MYVLPYGVLLAYLPCVVLVNIDLLFLLLPIRPMHKGRLASSFVA
jgi:hypothetical protein